MLIDNIASSENLRYNTKTNKSRIVFKVFYNDRELCAQYDYNGTHASYPDDFPYDLKIEQVNDLAEFLNSKSIHFKDNLEIFKDILVSVPHMHAIFSILENVIRNAAKHHKEVFDKDSSKKLEISIYIVEYNKGVENDDKYKIIITDNVSEFHGVIEQEIMKERMKVSFEKNQIPTDNLGILDMKICSQLLLGKNDFNFLEHEDSQAFRMNFSVEGRLQYIFHMLKTRNICIIGGPQLKANLTNKGVFYFNGAHEFLKSEVTTHYKFCLLHKEIFTLLDKVPRDIKESFLNKIPYRVIVIGAPTDKIKKTLGRAEFIEKENIIIDNLDSLLQMCWQKWMKKSKYKIAENELHLFFQENLSVIRTEQIDNQEIDIDSSIHTSTTSRWFAFQNKWNKNKETFKVITRYLVKDPENPKVQYVSYIDEVGDNIEYKDEKNYIIYDRHGASVPFASIIIPKNFSYELIDKASSDFDIIYTSNPLFDYNIASELLESGLLKILILDERVIEFSTTQTSKVNENDFYEKLSKKGFWNEDNHMTYFDAAWASRIYIASDYSIDGKDYLVKNRIDQNLNHYLKIDFSKDKIIGYSNLNCSPADGEVFDFDIIIIHRGIADRMIERNPRILEELKSKTNKIFITSGSGSLHGKTKNYEFVSLDIIKEAVMSCRINKFFLTRNLM